jgi:gamma-glutamyl-gamma-aminobutyraldehyde dehydrogenase
MSYDWHKLKQSIKLDGRHFINGKRVDSVDGSVIDKESPIDGKYLVSFARGKQADIDLAVSAANNVSSSWADLAPAKRKELLLSFAQKIKDNCYELALLETLDMGKPVTESLNVDVSAAVNCFVWYAEAIDKIYGEVAPTAKNSLAYIVREPIGVVGVIVPWNYPLIMTAWKLAPALATGNTIVLKPSERSPLTGLRLGELAKEAGIPDGVINVVAGYGHEAGEDLALHMGVGALGFTGSTLVGKKMLSYSSQSNLKRVYNELGGKSAVIVFNDYKNLDKVAATIAGSMFYNQGESCNAPSRVLVQEDIADKFVELLKARTKFHQPSDPLADNASMGAIVDKKHLDVVLSYIESAKSEGARCVTGGNAVLVNNAGYYIEPTIFDMVSPQIKIAREEIFGPVLSVIRFKTEAEAIHIANNSDYGLQAGIWSDDVNRVHRVARKLQAGTIHVNQYDGDNITVPFGGVKQSGNGRDKSLHALDKYTELKTVWLAISDEE